MKEHAKSELHRPLGSTRKPNPRLPRIFTAFTNSLIQRMRQSLSENFRELPYSLGRQKNLTTVVILKLEDNKIILHLTPSVCVSRYRSRLARSSSSGV